MVVRSYNSFSREEQREIDNDLYTALCARRQAAQQCAVIPFPTAPKRNTRRAGLRYGLCWAALMALLGVTLWGVSASSSVAVGTIGFGVLILIVMAGVPWLMQEHNKWRADK